MNFTRRALLGPGALGLVASALGTGCAASELPVRHVAVYRNGVAYFERSGSVAKNEVRFSMKPTDVGDFLATLAVVDGSGTAVRAAAFPSRAGITDNPKDSDRESVVLTLDGQPHDLHVGYVAQSPVWKPSYRLVMRSGGGGELQIWGIVENFSGEDWNGVALSLVAGAPIAFQADLGTPVTPTRPQVTDMGQANMPVPEGVLTLRAGHPVAAEIYAVEESGSHHKSAAQPPPPPRPLNYNMSATAPAVATGAGSVESSVVLAGGSSRYDLPLPVTIRDGGASMVLALSRPVSGEVVMLFAPQQGVSDSSSHPFRAACFKNTTGGTIERGPIAMFEEGAFLGQGLLDPLPAGATATLPFALERSVEVVRDSASGDGAVRLAAIEHGELFVEQDRLTSYRLANGTDAPAKVLVRHARLTDSHLVSPPEGTTEELSRGTVLVPVNVPAHGTERVALDETGAGRRTAEWLTDVAAQAVQRYMDDPKSDADAAQKLSAAWAIRRELVKKTDERYSLNQETYSLGQKTPQPADAKAKIAANTRRIAELDAKIAALTTQFHDALLGIRVGVP
jgi:hypothetical protein